MLLFSKLPSSLSEEQPTEASSSAQSGGVHARGEGVIGAHQGRSDESTREPAGDAGAKVRRVVANEDQDPSEKIEDLLRIGAGRLGVENAHLVEIDPADGTHTVVEVNEPHPVIEVGGVADLSTTYCRKVVAEGGPLAVSDAEAEGWGDDPAYQTWGLSCYHGTKVVVGEELYGTACFVDREPRESAFAETDATFVELVAQAIGQILEQRRRLKAAKKEQRKLERTQHLLRRVQRAAKVGGWELEAGAEETFWTEEVQLMLGLDEESPGLETVLRRMDPEAEGEVRAAIKRCIQNEEPFTVEASLEQDGSGVSTSERIEVHGVPAGMRGGDGAEKVVGAVRDITDRKRWREKVELTRRESIQRLARAAEHRDNDTGEHIRRVGRLSRLVAEALGKSPEWQERILEAAPLHDVGKIGIADEILLKPSGLTDAEYQVIKQHTVIGADLLSGGRSELIRMTQRVARHHHERWDGEGYPDGLEGEEIPLAARIVGVVDTFDAMTSDRPYRDALPAEKAFAVIEEEAGAQFDPQVSRAALRIRDALAEFA